MIEIESTYYEAEVREGFYIPSIMKKAWATNLKVFSEVDRICKKYNITYFASYGTLLGAVRHGGYIPWDDDLDIMMKRSDYERFLEVADKELPEGFTILNAKNTDNFWYFLSRVATGKHMRFEEDYLEEMHGFPYITGLDIFVLDRISKDGELENQRDKMINFILAVADNLETEGRLHDESIAAIPKIEKLCGVKINRKQSDYRIRKDLYEIAIKLCSSFENEKDSNLARLMPDVLNHGAKGYPSDFFDEIVYMPFENALIPVPARYDNLMKSFYGNYIKVVKQMAGHDYAFFEKQKAQFEEVWGQKFPEYAFDKSSIEPVDRLPSYKVYIQEYINNIIRLVTEDITTESLVEAQELAIDLGTFIDEVKGENTQTVASLEKFCEAIFTLYEQRVNGTDENDAEQVKHLIEIANDIKEIADSEIINREQVVFISFSAKHWDKMSAFYKKELENQKNDVFVMPIPYLYKDYKGEIVGEVFNIEEYSSDLNLLDYASYDWELNNLDRIYIQYPYDNWNDETTIPQQFYSNNLKIHTKELIYIPYFRVDDFDKNYEREYYNMKYYCNMPAVVNADKIILNSENLKDVYVQKLIEFAGEDTREIWENKIWVEKSELVEDASDKANSEALKKILFFESYSDLVQHGQKAIDKIKDVRGIFEENSNKISVIWVADPLVEINKDKIDSKIYSQYLGLIETFTSQPNNEWIEVRNNFNLEKIVEKCDAFYGDSSRLAYLCTRVKKPVMIKDTEI